MAVVDLGGGRKTQADRINPAVGLSDVAPLGARIEKGDLLLRIHAATMETAFEVAPDLLQSFSFADQSPPPVKLLQGKVS